MKNSSRLLVCLLLALCMALPAMTATAEESAQEPITFTVFHPDANRKIPPDDAEIVKQVEDYTGVKLEWIVPAAEPRERLNIMLATGDMPDLIVFWDANIMQQFIQAGKLLPLEALMKENAPKTYSVNYASFLDKIRAEDGDFYFLPGGYSFGDESLVMPETDICFSSRSKLLEELDWYNPETLDDVYELLKICKERYPEMSPMALALGPQGHLSSLNQIGAGAYGLSYVENLVLQGDQLVYFDDSPEMKEWYAYLNKIYRDGLMDIESPIMSSEMLKQKVVAGKVFSFFGPGWEIGSEFIAYMADNGSDEVIHYYQMPKANDSVEQTTYATYTMGLYSTGTTVTTSCKDPERFFQFYEMMNTEEGWMKSRGIFNFDFTGENTFENTEGYDWVALNDVEPIRDGRTICVASQWMGDMWGADENWWWNRGLESFTDFTYGEVNHPEGQYDIVGTADVGMWWEPQRAKVYAAYGLTGTNYFDYMRAHSANITDISGLVLEAESEAAIAAVNLEEYVKTQLPKIIVAETEEEFERLWSELKDGLAGYGKETYVTAKNQLYRERMEKWSAE